MYLTRVEIQNIRSISHLVWEIDAENAAGWHVILGDNGAGKSTFVRGAVLGVIGGTEVSKLNHYVAEWLNNKSLLSEESAIRPFKMYAHLIKMSGAKETTFGGVICKLLFDSHYDRIKISYTGDKPPKFLENNIKIEKTAEQPARIAAGGSNFFVADKDSGEVEYFNSAFFASFGPFRRFSGGDTEDNDLFESNPVLRRHRTTFSERLALPDALKWLQQTQFKALEDDANAKKLIADIKDFVNQADFLPHNTRLDKVNSSGVHFVDGNGAQVAAEELSDGYRSVLSLTFELLRLLSLTYPDGPPLFDRAENGTITVAPPGVVLIDEVDAHLHPTWQKRIGFWLCKHFPRMQFIVTTHSPLICQASAQTGTIYKLPTPGTNETGRMLTGTERDRLVYGDILDAYSTEAFGAGITRSEASQDMLKKLGSLNVKEMRKGLNKAEKEEQQRLRAMLPTAANSIPAG